MPFSTLGVPSLLIKGLRVAGIFEPTPIQRKAIPIILKGNDLIGAAQSGTGKTASYLLPTLTRLMEGPRRLRALVLAPTRELCGQIEAAGRGFARFTPVRVSAVFQGVPVAGQERLLREEGVDLLIATPARLLELHGRQAINVEDVEILVLDEADRMVDMGMASDLRRLLKTLPETRQTLLFAGSMPPELNRLAKEALVEPLRVDHLAPPTRPAAGITQAIYPVPRALKADLLNEVLTRHEIRSAVVFTNTRQTAEQLQRVLERRGHRVGCLHGSDNQMQRERAVNDLKRGRVQILVATDVASRGMPMDGISHVVNFDVPHRPEDYLYRIGHTAKEQGSGDAFTLMSPEEQASVAAIERFLGRTVPRVMIPDFDYRMRSNEIKQAIMSPKPPPPRLSPKPVTKPAPKPVVKPAPRPVAKPAAKPVARPAAKPAPRPAAKPAAKPAARVAKKPARPPVRKAVARSR